MHDEKTLNRLLNEKEVAALLGISVATIRRRRLFNQPPAALKIGAAVRYRASDVEAFVNQCPRIGATASDR